LATPCLERVHSLKSGQSLASDMPLDRIDPLRDARWDEFVRAHPRASLFHSPEWLRTLSRTYGYQPLVLTTTSPGQSLQNGVVFCEVKSWATGRRLVSLPFSDYCEPLVHEDGEAALLSLAIEQESRFGKWRYIELRRLHSGAITSSQSQSSTVYTLHRLDLSPGLEEIFQNFHKSSTQRKVRRAEREKLDYREGGMEYFEDFYRLFTITRKRHRRPPQPRIWFQNLMQNFGDALKIRVAHKDNRVVAAIMTIRYKNTMVYKYGGSNPEFNSLGSMHLLFWKSIQEAKALGLQCFDFGRTETDQPGLITFKRRWGTRESVLRYSRFGTAATTVHSFEPSTENWKSAAASAVFAHLPVRVLPVAGRLLYKHVG